MKTYVVIVDSQERVTLEASDFQAALTAARKRQEDGWFESIHGLFAEEDASLPSVERAYRLMAEGETRSAMEELEREFKLRPAYLECAVADLIKRARA